MPVPLNPSWAPIKFDPVTITVNVAPRKPPTGFTDVTDGGTDEYTENITVPEMPEGAWLATLMESAPDVVSRFSGMVVRRVVELTTVVGSDSPLTLTTDVLVKPLPVAVIATAGEPTRALFGTISCSTGLLWPKTGQATAIQKTRNLKALFIRVLLAVYAPFTTTLGCGVSELSLTGDESILSHFLTVFSLRVGKIPTLL